MGDPYSTPPITTATCVTSSISGRLLGNEDVGTRSHLDAREARESLQHIRRLESEVSSRAEDNSLRLG